MQTLGFPAVHVLVTNGIAIHVLVANGLAVHVRLVAHGTAIVVIFVLTVIFVLDAVFFTLAIFVVVKWTMSQKRQCL